MSSECDKDCGAEVGLLILSFLSLDDVVFSALLSKDDDVRHAAAFALGNIAAGRLNK